MVYIAQIANSINRFTDRVGRIMSWLTLVLVILVVVVVLSRYLLGVGSIAIQESVTYLHATIFMLGLAFTLQRGGHVRVDIFYRNYSLRRKALVDLLGAIFFLIPFCTFVFFSSWDYVMASWATLETSSETGGIAAIYLLKTLMLIMPITLGIQGVAEILNSIIVLKGAPAQGRIERDEQIL